MLNFGMFSRKNNVLFLVTFLFLHQQILTFCFSHNTGVWAQGKTGEIELVEIKKLRKGDCCLSLNLEDQAIENTKILEVVSQKKTVVKLTLAVLSDFSVEKGFEKTIEICLSGEQSFFMPKFEKLNVVSDWMRAKDLMPGNFLLRIPFGQTENLTIKDFVVVVLDVETLQEEQDVYCFSLEKKTVSLVSDLGIVVCDPFLDASISFSLQKYFGHPNSYLLTVSRPIDSIYFLACGLGIINRFFCEIYEIMKKENKKKLRIIPSSQNGLGGNLSTPMDSETRLLCFSFLRIISTIFEEIINNC